MTKINVSTLSKMSLFFENMRMNQCFNYELMVYFCFFFKGNMKPSSFFWKMLLFNKKVQRTSIENKIVAFLV